MGARAEGEALGPRAFTEPNAETRQKFADGEKRLFLAHRGHSAQVQNLLLNSRAREVVVVEIDLVPTAEGWQYLSRCCSRCR